MTTEQRQAVRRVVVLLVASITASVGFALLTLVLRHDVLAYQQARDPSATPSALAASLWTRPVPILLVALFYAGVIRKFRAGSWRAHRRIRIVSAAGFAAVAWLLFSAAYPWWLRPVQAVQLALLAALIHAVNRPVLRAAFPPVPDPRPRNLRAALTLAVLAPLIAEVSLGTVTLRQAWVIPLYIPIYGAGALFIREIARRSGAGLPGLLLLGVAYGLIEEGLALQSLTSPHLYGAAEWAPRLFGLNTAYTELNLAYHAVFSVTIPIVLVELLFRAHGRSPYLRRPGLTAAGVLALLGAALIRVSVPPTEDPGYTMPLPAALAIVTAAAALTVIALRRRKPPTPAGPLPPAQPPAATSTPPRPPAATMTPPRPFLVAVAAALAAFGFLAMIWPFGSARQPMFTHGAWAFAPMTAAAAIAVAAGLAARRWSSSANWTPAHTLAACFGALTAHTCFGLAVNADTTLDRLFLLTTAVITATAGGLLTRRAAAAPSSSPTPRAHDDAATRV